MKLTDIDRVAMVALWRLSNGGTRAATVVEVAAQMQAIGRKKTRQDVFAIMEKLETGRLLRTAEGGTARPGRHYLLTIAAEDVLILEKLIVK